MVLIASEKNWLAQSLLIYQASNPFKFSEQYLNLNENNSSEEILDDFLYKEVKENGILGCPVITESLLELAEKLDFPQQRQDNFTLSGNYILRCNY